MAQLSDQSEGVGGESGYRIVAARAQGNIGASQEDGSKFAVVNG